MTLAVEAVRLRPTTSEREAFHVGPSRDPFCSLSSYMWEMIPLDPEHPDAYRYTTNWIRECGRELASGTFYEPKNTMRRTALRAFGIPIPPEDIVGIWSTYADQIGELSQKSPRLPRVNLEASIRERETTHNLDYDPYKARRLLAAFHPERPQQLAKKIEQHPDQAGLLALMCRDAAAGADIGVMLYVNRIMEVVTHPNWTHPDTQAVREHISQFDGYEDGAKIMAGFRGQQLQGEALTEQSHELFRWLLSMTHQASRSFEVPCEDDRLTTHLDYVDSLLFLHDAREFTAAWNRQADRSHQVTSREFSHLAAEAVGRDCGMMVDIVANTLRAWYGYRIIYETREQINESFIRATDEYVEALRADLAQY
jgi:hypothetical protein